jgi:hypothetical protein
VIPDFKREFEWKGKTTNRNRRHRRFPIGETIPPHRALPASISLHQVEPRSASTRKIVYTERFDEDWYPGEALITTTLIEKDGSTTLRTTMLMESREARDEVLESGMESGVIVSYDRLEEILSSQGAGKRNE